GIGWYRKTFETPAITDSRVYLHFDGVYCNSEVWINGIVLGRRPNGYIPFRYDLTPHLTADSRQVIAVRVDHTRFGDSRWYTGSGIYRNVRLIVTDSILIGQWGIFVTTPVVREEQAQVRVEVRLENHLPSPAEVRVENVLFAADGTVVGETTVSVSLPELGEKTVEGSLIVDRPELWSVDHPILYRLRTVVYRDGQAIDAEETPVGIRSFRFDPDHGFHLNGANLKLKGVCLHEDAGAFGVAVPAKVWERRLERLKEAGTNALRMAHNPHLPELYDLCDRMGFLVQEEAFDEWEQGKNKWIAGWNVGTPGKDGYHEHFREWAEADLRDMVLSRRNHPSVIMWSIGNEIDYPNDPYTHEVLDNGTNPQSFGRGYRPDLPHASRLTEVARELVRTVKRYDPTRPVTAALSAALIANEIGLADALDIVGYNYQEYRYRDDHARFPNRVLYGSENGMREDFWRAVTENDFIAGQFLWTGIDYLGEAHGWPARSNTAGILDLAGNRKPEFYFRRCLWNPEPMVWLGSREVPTEQEQAGLWSHQKAQPVWEGREGESIRVVCFTNCDTVELFLNGRWLGVLPREVDGPHLVFRDVAYQPGTLTARGFLSGREVASAFLRTSGPPRKLRVEADSSVLTADGRDLVHLEVLVTDADGTPVFDGDHEITWTIDGPARLLCLESGDPASHEDYRSDRRRAFRGRLLGYVGSTRECGEITVRLTAPELEGAVVTLRSEG
ncbi:MAG: glycoside hydrolase family 2 TIM barrel-domain containing protein, partial [Capsulimonadales bacterium]|nr:glycoside hydrolase family 2 TIM barrel-domain containing protein [Capsulimonadales bacterium]